MERSPGGGVEERTQAKGLIMADIDATPTAGDNDLEGGTLVTGAYAQSNLGTGTPSTSDAGTSGASGTSGGSQNDAPKSTDPRQMLKDGASKYQSQATDKIRTLADTGKHKAGGALDQFSTMLTDAAGQVDEKLGAQYGDYARQAADMVTGFSDSIKNKDVEDLLEDARGFVRQSPAVAIGVAAALGFVVARLAQSGMDGNTARSDAPGEPTSQG